MDGERDRLRQWLQKKIEAGKTARAEPQFIALEEIAKRLQLDVEYLSQLHRESALFRLVTMPDGRRHVRQEEILTLLRRGATRPGLPLTLDQTFHRPEDLAAEIGIPLGDFLDLLRQGEVGAVRVESFLRVPEEEIHRLLREMEGPVVKEFGEEQ
ncbi:MAG: hypothetical protein ACE5JQ_12530 [Candidatus Methylomirabilales bacterium]